MSAQTLPRRAARAAAACAAFLLPALAAACRDSTAVAPARDTAPVRKLVSTPSYVSVPGTFNTAMGCAGDWDPACPQAQLSQDANDLVWKGTYVLPAASYDYKAAIDKSWDENYGLNATENGANIPLTSDGSTPITFFYDHATHWITSTANSPIVTAPGSFQSELGCAGDWDPACMRSWLEDTDADGVFTFSTTALPVGDYEVKVTVGRTWDVNYGQGGAPNGANIPFSVAVSGSTVDFSFDGGTHALTITVTPPLTAQTIAFTSTAPSPAYLGGTYAVSASATSGLAVTLSSLTPTVCTVSGGTVSFVALGTCTVAADQAGDATYSAAPRVTQTMQVVWLFTGFLSPLANPPSFNDATAGATVPVKFGLGGYVGLNIFAAGSPSSAPLACPTTAAVTAVVAASTTRTGGLSYDARTGVYTYSWVTSKGWKNGCRKLTVTLADGTTHEAYFRFR
jgi:hypothetical protein